MRRGVLENGGGTAAFLKGSERYGAPESYRNDTPA
jgi:hypothetical protein